MPQLRVTVPKLNKRRTPVEDTSDKSNVVGWVRNGEIIESNNFMVNKIGKWHQDDHDKLWSWAPGLGTNYTFDATKMSWAHDSVANGGLGIVDLWNKMGVRGEGVKVVILDTGISDNRDDFKDKNSISVIKGEDYIKGVNGLDNTIDINGHGTNSAAIIVGTGEKKVFGIAPNADVYIIRIGGNLFTPIKNLENGIQLLKQNGWTPDIISISFCFPIDSENLKKLIQPLLVDCVVVCSLSHPDNSNSLAINDNQFPAFYDNVIPVTAIDKKNQIVSPCDLLNQTICWAFPGDSILTLDKKGNQFLASQTSIAAPFGTGVLALFLSFMKQSGININQSTIKILKNLLMDESIIQQPILNNGFQKNLSVCLCNPFEAFKKFSLFFKKTTSLG